MPQPTIPLAGGRLRLPLRRFDPVDRGDVVAVDHLERPALIEADEVSAVGTMTLPDSPMP